MTITLLYISGGCLIIHHAEWEACLHNMCRSTVFTNEQKAGQGQLDSLSYQSRLDIFGKLAMNKKIAILKILA